MPTPKWLYDLIDRLDGGSVSFEYCKDIRAYRVVMRRRIGEKNVQSDHFVSRREVELANFDVMEECAERCYRSLQAGIDQAAEASHASS